VINGKKLVIIMGAPRSGTTWLQALLNTHPAICTHSELWLFSHYTAPMCHAWQQQERTRQNKHAIGLPSLWTAEQFQAYQRDFIARVYADVAASHPDSTIILDKTPGYTLYVDHINALVPDAHFIHIIRDGRSAVASRLAAQATWWNVFQFDATRIARDWTHHVTMGRKAAQFDGRYTEVRYETLLTDGVAELQRIFAAIDLDIGADEARHIYDAHTIDKMRAKYTHTGDTIAPETVTANGIFVTTPQFYRRGQADSWDEDLSVIQRYDVLRASQPLLRELGYADDRRWWHPSPIVRATLPLGLAVVRWLNRIRQSATRILRRA
jgi:hypothetical protein